MFVVFVFVVTHYSAAKLQRIIGTRARKSKKFAGKGEKTLDTTRNGQEWTRMDTNKRPRPRIERMDSNMCLKEEHGLHG